MTQSVLAGSVHETFASDGEDADGALLVAARRDPARFGEFYDRNFAAVFAFFYRRTLCAEIAADLSAEAFTAALSGLHRFREGSGTGRAWLFGIANNLFRQWLRKGRIETRARNRLEVSTPAMNADELDQVEATLDLGPLVAALPEALSMLTPALRDAIVMRVSEQLPYAEIASRLGCSEGSARVRVSRGLDRLHQELAAL